MPTDDTERPEYCFTARYSTGIKWSPMRVFLADTEAKRFDYGAWWAAQPLWWRVWQRVWWRAATVWAGLTGGMTPGERFLLAAVQNGPLPGPDRSDEYAD